MKEKQIEELLWKIRGSSMKIKEERENKEIWKIRGSTRSRMKINLMLWAASGPHMLSEWRENTLHVGVCIANVKYFLLLNNILYLLKYQFVIQSICL